MRRVEYYIDISCNACDACDVLDTVAYMLHIDIIFLLFSIIMKSLFLGRSSIDAMIVQVVDFLSFVVFCYCCIVDCP